MTLLKKKSTNRCNGKCLILKVKDGAPGEIRTPDRSVRSRVLYPAELQALNLKAGFYGLLREFASLFCILSAIFSFDVRTDITEDFVGYGL
jgi:hypothetical protein